MEGGGIGGHLVFKMPTPAPLVLEWIKAMMEITWSSPRDMMIKKVEIWFKIFFFFSVSLGWNRDGMGMNK